jgi:tRNA wybutosine-synthesizing protein 1
MFEDEENDRLLRAADLEDSDEDSDMESTTKESTKKSTKKTTTSSSSSHHSSGESGEGIVDVEDMGNEMNAASAKNTKEALKKSLIIDEGNEEDGSTEGDYVVVPKLDERAEMVTPLQRKALTKEGYKIIGTHSAVSF